MAITSRHASYKTTSVHSEWGLGVEGCEALLVLRVRTGVEYPEDTLRGLMCHSVQFSSVDQSCPTLYDPKNHSTAGLPVHHQLPEFTQTHDH